MDITVTIAGVACACAVLACLAGLAWAIGSRLMPTEAESGAWSRLNTPLFYIPALLMAGLLLRPHEHTFQGLDASAYRLMASAFAEGRPLKSEDKTLLEAPYPLRKQFLYRPVEIGRITRDQSFEIESLHTCRTKPFYYPLLALSMVGFDLLLPGDAMDYFVPIIGLLFCVICLAVGTARGRLPGMLLTLCLLLGSPLPTWLFRGCFPESVAAILISLTVLLWVGRDWRGAVFPSVPFFALGLAVSFHPVMAVIAVPIACVLLFEAGDSPWRLFRHSVFFMAGLMPIVLLTVFVATPYGPLTMSNFRLSIVRNASIRPALLVCATLVVPLIAAFPFRRFLLRKLSEMRERRYPFAALLAVLWVLPTALPAVKRKDPVEIRILRLRPVSSGESPAVHKVFDGGPLALRMPWGRNDIPIDVPGVGRLPACWSRDGSGIVGPVPPPGGSVRIRVDGTAGRADGADHQVLRFSAPWTGDPLRLTVSNTFMSASGVLRRPSDQADDGTRTGVYTIHSEMPYDPGKHGIRGFSHDLGALIHLIRIDVAPDANPSPAERVAP